ncbi:phage terminase small subunit P27 family [Orrella sp. 11846]|uniref:phage terminase small subunit P27 family n=1 Tax=Orrella sp. 11846 TaxID=3409913 RepID=UPI003B5B47FB
MRGRKPKPTALKIIADNPGKRPLNINEPQLPLSDLVTPDWLTDDQKLVWQDAVESCPPGLVTTVDEKVLAIWVVACDLHRQAAERVAQMGMIVKSPVKGDPMQNPWLAIVNRQAQIMMKAAAELGFTPSSRSRVTLSGAPKAQNRFASNAVRRGS